MVECFLAKEDVAGSTPVSRSKKSLPAVHFTYNKEAGLKGLSAGFEVESPPARRGTQVVRERSAKPLCVGSIPTRASKFPQIPWTNRGTVSMCRQGVAFVTYVF